MLTNRNRNGNEWIRIMWMPAYGGGWLHFHLNAWHFWNGFAFVVWGGGGAIKPAEMHKLTRWLLHHIIWTWWKILNIDWQFKMMEKRILLEFRESYMKFTRFGSHSKYRWKESFYLLSLQLPQMVKAPSACYYRLLLIRVRAFDSWRHQSGARDLTTRDEPNWLKIKMAAHECTSKFEDEL